MDILGFLTDIFAHDGNAQMLAANIVEFVVEHCENAYDASRMFAHLLDGIGVTDEDCKKFGEWLFDWQDDE